ncbi:hypothetical protein Lser_V15G34760 [Lactuca serriola]
MDFDMPTDLINQSQIGFRELAGLSSFNPSDTTLPSPPTIEASISTLDPSPPYLRCKYCQGKLLRGLQSLICIYCGEHQKKDLHPDPIPFNSTSGYSWLLQSLNLHGSERVGSLAEGNGVHGGQSPAEDIVTLSELLDMQISWRDEPKKPDNSFNNKTSDLTNPLNLGTTNLDNFFTERIASDASEVQQVSSKQDQNQAFETSFPSSIDVNDDASSDWNAEFQFADSKVENESPKPVDPFVVVPEAVLSAHMDAVFGQMEVSNNIKPNEDKDWIQDDLFTNMGPTTFQQAEQLDAVVKPNDEFPAHLNNPSSKDVDQDWFSDNNWQKSSVNNSQDKPNDSFTESVSVDWFENANWQKSSGFKKGDFNPQINESGQDHNVAPQISSENKSLDFDNIKKQDLDTSTDWFQESQWSTGPSSATNIVNTKEDDDFDDWNDFTSSTPNQDSYKQSSNQDSFPDSWKQSSEKIPELDFFSESSTTNRNVNGEGGNNTPNANANANATTTSPENEVQMLLSQMHDLSFMLKSELSIPSKTDDRGPSHG